MGLKCLETNWILLYNSKVVNIPTISIDRQTGGFIINITTNESANFRGRKVVLWHDLRYGMISISMENH